MVIQHKYYIESVSNFDNTFMEISSAQWWFAILL
jgi:hypothetical protein